MYIFDNVSAFRRYLVLHSAQNARSIKNSFFGSPCSTGCRAGIYIHWTCICMRTILIEWQIDHFHFSQPRKAKEKCLKPISFSHPNLIIIFLAICITILCKAVSRDTLRRAAKRMHFPEIANQGTRRQQIRYVASVKISQNFLGKSVCLHYTLKTMNGVNPSKAQWMRCNGIQCDFPRIHRDKFSALN